MGILFELEHWLLLEVRQPTTNRVQYQTCSDIAEVRNDGAARTIKPSLHGQVVTEDGASKEEGEANVFVKPNEQNQACLSSAMARKRRYLFQRAKDAQQMRQGS